jgi:hypothetical protein
MGGRHRAAAIQHPPLARHERILRRSETINGSVVATQDALLLGDRVGAWQRIGWVAVAAVGWSARDGCLSLRLWPDGEDQYRDIAVAADARLAAIVAERVDSVRVLSVPVRLPSGINARVLALRDGDAVQWRVLTDRPIESPGLQQECARALAEIRSLAGI